MTVTASERLRRFYSVFKNDDQVLVVINADPDAVGAALAVKRLLWRKVTSVAICSVNIMKRPDNVALVDYLGVKILKISEVAKSNYTRFVMVDSQPEHNECFQRFDFDVIIDHHPVCKSQAPFTDIRPEYGATSSMLTEYIKAAKIRPSVKLATALFIGIKTDTNDFQRKAFGEDVKAFQYLFKYVNINLVQKVEYAEINPSFLKYFQLAFNTRVMHRGRVYIHLGHVGTPDVCVLIADFFLKIKGVGWTFVSGIYAKKLVVIIRNDGLRKDAGKTAGTAFGKLGSAGGHKNMARAEIPLSVLEGKVDLSQDKKVLKWMIGRIEKKKT